MCENALKCLHQLFKLFRTQFKNLTNIPRLNELVDYILLNKLHQSSIDFLSFLKNEQFHKFFKFI